MSSFEGLSWQQWPPVPDDDLQDSSTQSSLAPSPQPPLSLTEQDPLMLDPSPSLSPKQASSSSASAVITCDEDEDVMRLPRRDMHIFGQCPIQDEFVLVTCDVCGRHVKMEAFEHHFRLRHDKDAMRVPSSSVAASVAQRIKRNVLRPCTVELTKDDLALSSLSSSSSSSSGNRTSLKQSTSPSPVLSIKEEPEPMEVEQPSFVTVDVPSSLGQSSSASKPQQGSSTTFVSVEEEEADSTTSNVISIPDTDPLPHSVSNDLMAMVSGDLSETATAVKTEPGASSVDSTSAASAAAGVRLKPMIKLQIQTPVASPMQKPHLQPTVTLASAAPGESLVIKKGSPSKKGKSGAAGERKPQREYHPDRHCGVWDNDNKRHCTRALTCKSHSVLLKRKVEGRSRNFDELVAEHKAVKEANAAAAAAAAQAQQARAATAQTTAPSSLTVESVLNSITEPNPIEQRPKMPTAWSGPVPQMATPTMTTVKGLRVNPVLPKRLLGSRESDENLHYTTDHPRPLALCTLGAKRLGGLYVSDRSQFLTRKVIRVAIAANGLRVRTRPNTSGGGGATVGGGVKYLQNCTVKRAVHAALQPRMQQQQQQPQQVPQQQYMVNYNVTRPVGLQVSAAAPAAVTAAAAAATRIGGVSLSTLAPGTTMAVSSTTGGGNIGIGNMPPNINIVPAAGGDVSFKTDIQDFKGGIKFELGRKIKHILPMGTEVTK